MTGTERSPSRSSSKRGRTDVRSAAESDDEPSGDEGMEMTDEDRRLAKVAEMAAQKEAKSVADKLLKVFDKKAMQVLEPRLEAFVEQRLEQRIEKRLQATEEKEEARSSCIAACAGRSVASAFKLAVAAAPRSLVYFESGHIKVKGFIKKWSRREEQGPTSVEAAAWLDDLTKFGSV